MKKGFDFSRFRSISLGKCPVVRPLFRAAAPLLMMVFAVSCVERPSPDQVTAAYFKTVANGDPFAVRPFLTPDGQEILDQMAAMPQIRAAIESQRGVQKQFWSGIVCSVSQPSIEGSRAVVVFTAEVPGRGRASCPVVLFLIDGDWRISSTSISGIQTDRFRNELMALKAPPAKSEPPAAAPSAAAPAAPAAAPPAAAPSAAAPAAAPAAVPEKK